MRPFAFPKGLTDTAVAEFTRSAVTPSMVNELVHVAAEQVVGAVITQQTETRGIAEHAIAVGINSVDGLGRRIEQQFELLFQTFFPRGDLYQQKSKRTR